MEVKTFPENCFAPSRGEQVMEKRHEQTSAKDIIDDPLSMISRSLGVMSGWTLANIANKIMLSWTLTLPCSTGEPKYNYLNELTE